MSKVLLDDNKHKNETKKINKQVKIKLNIKKNWTFCDFLLFSIRLKIKKKIAETSCTTNEKMRIRIQWNNAGIKQFLGYNFLIPLMYKVYIFFCGKQET